jgi:Phosphoenolpyruvate phosphomutase
MTTLRDQAGRLRLLHQPGQPLVLPNVWDAASARIIQEAGYAAVATASAAIAAMLGYPDHQRAPHAQMLAAAGRVAQAVHLPVTVDAEAGDGLPANELVERLVRIGAAGLNLEDTGHATGQLVEAAEQVASIAAVRAAASNAGMGLAISARTDPFVRGETPTAVTVAIQRGRRYLEAGADCIYPILAVSRRRDHQAGGGSARTGQHRLRCRRASPAQARPAGRGADLVWSGALLGGAGGVQDHGDPDRHRRQPLPTTFGLGDVGAGRAAGRSPDDLHLRPGSTNYRRVRELQRSA